MMVAWGQTMDKARIWLRGLAERMDGLNRRERLFVYSAAVFLALFILVRFVIIPLTGEQARLEQALTVKKDTLREMVSMSTEVAAASGKLQEARAGLKARDKDFTLFAFLDKLAGETGVKNNITYMKPSTEESEQGDYRLSAVEMKLEAVSLSNLVSYIYKVEMPENMVFIKRLSISRQEQDIGGVDAVLQVITVTEG